MKGIAVDLSKAFDNVPEKITFPVLEPKLFKGVSWDVSSNT